MFYMPLKLKLDNTSLRNRCRKLRVQICVQLVLISVQFVCINLIQSVDDFKASIGVYKVTLLIAGE
jgi:hypothetical protein